MCRVKCRQCIVTRNRALTVIRLDKIRLKRFSVGIFKVPLERGEVALPLMG